MEISLELAFLTMVAGGILSFSLEYIPGLSGWFEPLPSMVKRYVNWGLIALVGVGVVVAGCNGLVNTVSCDAGLWQTTVNFLMSLLGGLIGNSVIFTQTKKLPQPTVETVTE